MTPEEAAQALYEAIPRGIAPDLLQEYGIEATDQQAHDITREVLSLNLYWVRAAIDAHIPRQYRSVLFDRLLELIRSDWEARLEQPWEEYLLEFKDREALYRPLGNEPGGEMAVSVKAGAVLEDEGIVAADDRAKVLALLIDHLPLDRYGELLGTEH
jgi:hypothetical protein